MGLAKELASQGASVAIADIWLEQTDKSADDIPPWEAEHGLPEANPHGPALID